MDTLTSTSHAATVELNGIASVRFFFFAINVHDAGLMKPAPCHDYSAISATRIVNKVPVSFKDYRNEQIRLEVARNKPELQNRASECM